MFQTCGLLSWVVAFALAVTLSGCWTPPSQEKQKPADRKAQEKPTGQAELSAADRAAAEKQRVCPVSGDVLGAMGKPYKVTVKGRTVFLCCPDCEEAIMKDPDKYLAKLKPDQQQ